MWAWILGVGGSTGDDTEDGISGSTGNGAVADGTRGAVSGGYNTLYFYEDATYL